MTRKAGWYSGTQFTYLASLKPIFRVVMGMKYCGCICGLVDCDGKCANCEIAKEYEEAQIAERDMQCEEAGLINAMIRAGW